MNTIGYSRPLALCSVISVTRPSSSVRVVGVGDQRDLLQELGQRSGCRSGSAASYSTRDVDELLEVLDPSLRLDRPLGLERLEVAGLAQHLLEQLGDRRRRLGPLAQHVHRAHEAPQRLDRGRAEPGHLLGLGRQLPDRSRRSCWRTRSTREIEVEPIPRRGELTIRVNAPDVLRVDEHRQVGDRVLDLGALVELRAADHLVGDLGPHERVLEHPRLRVGAVEDGDLRPRRRPRRRAAGSRR